MASFVSFAPPPVYGLLPSQHHGAQLEEPVPTDDEDSGYGSDDSGFMRPSLIDTLGLSEGISRHDLSTLSLRQRPPRCAPLIRHIIPFTSPDRDDIKSGPDLDDGNSPHLHHHEHKSRIPTCLPPLSNRVQSDTDDSSSATPPHPNSPNTHSPPKNPSTTSLRSSATPVRAFAASNQTSDQDLCGLHDRHLAADWQKLNQASRKLERQRAALMARRDVSRVPYRRDFTDRRWASGTRGMSISDDGVDSEAVVDAAERNQRYGRGREIFQSELIRRGSWRAKRGYRSYTTKDFRSVNRRSRSLMIQKSTLILPYFQLPSERCSQKRGAARDRFSHRGYRSLGLSQSRSYPSRYI